jgi:exodeoxyribonuclease VII large subunit
MDCRRRLIAAARTTIGSRQATLDEYIRTLRAVSPQATLQRGYAIVSSENGTIARDAKNFVRGDHLSAKLAKGRLRLSVDDIEDDLPDNSTTTAESSPSDE